MNGGDQLGRMFLDRLRDLIQRHHRAPGRVDGFHPRADAAKDFRQQQSEAAEIDHQHGIARHHQRHQRRLDPGTRRAIDQESPAVLGAEDGAVQRHHLVHVFRHFRIELAQQVRRHGAQHARMGIDRAGAHQQPLRRIDLPEQLRHRRVLPMLPRTPASRPAPPPHRRDPRFLPGCG